MGFLEQMKERQARQAALGGTGPGDDARELIARAQHLSATVPPHEPINQSESVAPAPAAVDIRTRLANQGTGTDVTPPPFTPPTDATPTETAPSGAPAVTAAPVPRGRARARARAAAGVASPPTEVEPTAPPVSDIQAAADRDRADHQRTAISDGFVLCINCAPVGQPLTLFSHYVRPVHDQIKELKGWGHYGLGSFEGRAIFQDALTQYLEQEPPSGYLIVDSRTDEGRDALPILERHAVGNPFRGF